MGGLRVDLDLGKVRAAFQNASSSSYLHIRLES